MLVVAWVIILGGAYSYFSNWEAAQVNPNTAEVLNAQQVEVTLLRNREGHYLAEGEINRRRVTLMLDTGATWIAIPSGLASSLGLQRGSPVSVQTANGNATGYQTRLETVRLGPIEMQDLAALIVDGMNGETVLLGMNFLKRLEFAQREGRLTLRHARREGENR